MFYIRIRIIESLIEVEIYMFTMIFTLFFTNKFESHTHRKKV